MSFRMRNRDWSHQEECRAAVQLVDAYRVGRGPDHRIVVAGFSWGALNAYALAALGRSDATVLIAPVPHRLDVQTDKAVRNQGLAAGPPFAGRGRGFESPRLHRHRLMCGKRPPMSGS